MNWKIISEELVTEDNVHYIGYGIEYLDYRISDISLDRDEIIEIAGMLNRYGVTPITANDVIEDYLNR